MTIEHNKVASLNESFFGKDMTKRYITRVYADCVEKIILVNTINELWSRDIERHGHADGVGCLKCDIFSQMSYSCADSLFLHLRLLFSREEPLLSNVFLSTLSNLNGDDIKEYFKNKYDYTINEEEVSNLQDVVSKADTAVTEISKIYIKRIEPYQSYVFHQQDNGKHYKVVSSTTKGGGSLKIIQNIKSDKFKRDLVSAKNILTIFSEVLHDYKKSFCVYQNHAKLDVDRYVTEILEFINTGTKIEDVTEIVGDARSHFDQLIHVLECSDGLNSHNRLTAMAIKRRVMK